MYQRQLPSILNFLVKKYKEQKSRTSVLKGQGQGVSYSSKFRGRVPGSYGISQFSRTKSLIRSDALKIEIQVATAEYHVSNS